MKRNAITRIILYAIALLILINILGAGLGIHLYSVDHTEAGISHNQVPLITEGETVTSVVDAADIRELDIDWAAGSVSIIADAYTNKITVIEPKMAQEKHQMRCNSKNGKLSIEFREETVGFQGIDVSKELLIIVPVAWQCEELSIDTAAASIDVRDLGLANVEIDAASGICNFVNCNVNQLDIDTASGDMTFYGVLNYLDFDAASANCHLVLTEHVPISIDMDSMSGDLVVELPEHAGFVLQMDTMSGEFNTDFETELKDGKYRAYGKHQECMLNLSALSGDVTIRKHIHTEACIGKHDAHHN